MMRGMLKISNEPRSPHEGACLGYTMNLNRPIREVVCVCVCRIYNEPESKGELACLRYIMMSRNRRMKAHVYEVL